MTSKIKDFELSIIVPIYNGGEYVIDKLESLSAIPDLDYEVIIALNKSTDNTGDLVDKYSKEIPYLKVVKSLRYLEGLENYIKGFELAQGRYVIASAVDDIYDKGFYREAIELLEKNDNVIAISPITMFADNSHGDQPVNFELKGSSNQRLKTLFNNIRVSHGIFYSLMRRTHASELNQNYVDEYAIIGGDWLYDIKLALRGEVCRTRMSKCVFGVKGISKSGNVLNQKGVRFAKKVFPYHRLISKVISIAQTQKFTTKVILLSFAFRLVRGNLHRYFFSLFPKKIRD